MGTAHTIKFRWHSQINVLQALLVNIKFQAAIIKLSKTKQ